MTVKMEQAALVQKLLSKIKDIKMPIKTAYKMAQFSDELDKKVNFFGEKMRQIIEEYSEKTEEGTPKIAADGQSIEIKPDFIEICKKEINELSNLDIEIKEFTFTLNELEKFELSIEDLKILMPFIKEDEE